MKVLAYDPFLPEEACKAMGFDYTTDVNAIYKSCDIISISVPLTDQTRNMVGANEFEMMKSSTIIINASRGGIINEQALTDALKRNQIFGAAIDAFVDEPVPKDHELFSCFNFIGTPHNGANTKDALINMGTGAIDEIIRVEQGEKTLTDLGSKIK